MNDLSYVFDVFISYSHANQAWVHDWLVPRLEEAGLHVCIDFRDFIIGVPILANMERAVVQSRKTLLILTPDWVNSEWANFEALLIQTEDPINNRRRMLPLMLQQCEPPKRVLIFSYANFTQSDQWESQLRRVIDAICDKISLPQQEVSPAQITMRQPTAITTNNLPNQLTTFIGRKQANKIGKLLSSTRLLTLTGAPGTGKTRLALEVASDQLNVYADGVWWVELAALEGRKDPDSVQQAVAKAIGVHEESGHPLSKTIISYLEPKHLLLLLDNCEHLVEECAAFTNSLLYSCPNLRVLVTSREVLKISGELVWNVPPLAVPPEGQRLPALKDLVRHEAIRLFIDRARLNQRRFSVTEQNAASVTQICRRLGGLPLAIELVAARLKALSVEQINDELAEHFWVLAQGARKTWPYQQTLQATIDWSYDFLSWPESILFNRLSIFSGGFTLEASEAVTSGGEVNTYEVLDLLVRLVDKSLVTAEESTDASMRYRLLEPLRQYGRERLAASGETVITSRKHAEYYLALAEKLETKLSGPEQAVWQDRLERDHDNLRVALHWSQDNGEAEFGLRLAGALGRFWWLRDYLSEGRRWLERSLSKADDLSTVVQAKALFHAGRIAVYQGDFKSSEGLLQQSLAIYRRADAERGIAECLYQLGLQNFTQGNFEGAHSLIKESLTLYRKLDDKKNIADSLTGLGAIDILQGDYVTANGLLEESLSLFKELDHKLGIANVQHDLGAVNRYQGDYMQAHSLLEESLTIYRELGHRSGIARSLSTLGNVLLDEGEITVARTLLQESLVIVQELGIKEGIASLLESFGSLAIAESQPLRAVQLFGAAEALRNVINIPLDPAGHVLYDREIAAVRNQLDETTFTSIWAKGRAMSLEQAIKYVLEG